MPHIIIDGLDKTGKSTLARFLSEKTGMPIKKFSAPEKGQDPTSEYAEFLAAGEPSIIDRMWLSEMAYGPVMRGESFVDQSRQALLEEMARRSGSHVIYAYASEEELRKRFDADNETFTRKDQIESILAGYERAILTSRLTWIRYTIGDDMEAVYEQVR